MQNQQLHAIIQLLQGIRKRPQTFIHPLTVENAVHFLDGIDAVCKAIGFVIDRGPNTSYQQLIVSRGWTFLAARPTEEMQRKGLSVQEILEELLIIEIATWEKMNTDTSKYLND